MHFNIFGFCRTFDEIDMFPKNKLNLVIGPNGAGKSTFVCAIVLGLGGKPSTIGKITNVRIFNRLFGINYQVTIKLMFTKVFLKVADSIKHVCEKAVIVLELYNPNG